MTKTDNEMSMRLKINETDILSNDFLFDIRLKVHGILNGLYFINL